MKKRFALAAAACIGLFFSSCLDEQNPNAYYTFTGNTIASFLEDQEESFSEYIKVLKKAEIWGEMATYGDFTCFAPDNNAFSLYYQEKGVSGVDELTKAECDTIAWTHLLNQAYYTTDLVEGAFPGTNRLDRYLTFTADSDEVTGHIFYLVNKQARILERDDTVENGVIQIVDKVITPSSLYLADFMKLNPDIQLFYQALHITHMDDSLTKYIDESYVAPGGDSCTTGVLYHTGNEWEYAIFPEKRYFKYSAFVEPDAVYNEAGIYTLQDLIAYAKEVYDKSYPEDAGKYDDDFTNRRNPLNRFVSYHLLPFYGNYNDWNVTNQDLINNGNFKRQDWDMEDFFETLLPNSIMRFCSPERPSGLYINRKGRPGKYTHEGVRVIPPSEVTVDQDALNGIYHYIDKILVYDYTTRYEVLNTRIRFDCTTMSPDFVNSGGRNRPGETTCTGMKQGFVEGWTFSKETLMSIRNRHMYFWSYEGDELILQGIYDATVKLPPVPFDGTYEIRIGYPVMASRGVIQAYFGQDPHHMDPTDIPTDLRVSGPDPRVGWVSDGNLNGEDEIRSNAKSMRNRGYMKGPACYGAGADRFRDQDSMLRRILTTQYMQVEGEYYLRVRQILDNTSAEMVYDYLEMVPKSVYENNEDIY